MTASGVVAFDFFSGCGGTSWGLQNAGIDVLAAVDNDADAAASYRLNFPHTTFFETDITQLEPHDLNGLVPNDQLVLFAGCAPCQPFSAQQKHSDASDPRRSLLLEFLRFIETMLPHFVLVENVPGLQNVHGEDGPLPHFIHTLKELGYDVTVEVLRACDYGVPQVRRRLILLASRISPAKLPSPTHGKGLQPFATVRNWIEGMTTLAAGETDPVDVNHAAARLSELNLARIRATPEGGGHRDWPESLKAKCHRSYSGHSDSYGRLSWDSPASGLTTRCISYSNGRFGHPTQDRALSLREAALLQTFPPNYQFVGPLTSKARQVGNAVPPLLSEALGKRILELSQHKALVSKIEK